MLKNIFNLIIKKKMAKEDIVLLGFWASPFCLKVKVALAEKGIAYKEIEEENLLGEKSKLLLESNPIYQKVPVLLHNGSPVCESTNIVYYIDESWPSKPLLPSSAYERSRARFWADFIDKKVFEAGAKIWMSANEDELGVAKKGFIDILKKLEGAIGEKDYFGGDEFGFLDIIAIGLTAWFSAYERFGGFKVEQESPKFWAWKERCLKKESVAKAYPDQDKVYGLVGMLRKMNGIE